MRPDDIEHLPLVRKFADATGAVVDQKFSAARSELLDEMDHRIDQHRAEDHHLPPRRTRRVTAVPFADETLPDERTVWAFERMRRDGWTLEEAAEALDVPPEVLDLALCDYWPEYQRWKRERAYR